MDEGERAMDDCIRADQSRFQFKIPQQGIDKILDQDGAIIFFQDELSFFASIGPLLGENIQLAGRGLGNLQSLSRNAEQFLTRTRDQIKDNKRDLLEQYLGYARSLRVVVGQGVIGARITELHSGNRKEEAKWLMAIYSTEWFDTPELAALRAVVLGNPATIAAIDLIGAKTAINEATESRNQSASAATRLNQFVEDKTSVISDLESLYRQKLVIEEPAKFWAGVAQSRTWAWRIWLAIFAALVVVPVCLIIWFWQDFGNFVLHLTSSSNGPISLAGVAALSIPAFLYGWLLKNVSRMFIHHLNGADDAAHRRALCITYLGLAENPKLQITEQDRALILNALFRPIASQGLEEGPPTGLLDLIKPKSA
jgi:hypothetical protein